MSKPEMWRYPWASATWREWLAGIVRMRRRAGGRSYLQIEENAHRIWRLASIEARDGAP
jgi:hypothetical protein